MSHPTEVLVGCLATGWYGIFENRKFAELTPAAGYGRVREAHDIDFPDFVCMLRCGCVDSFLFDAAFALRDAGVFAGVGFLESKLSFRTKL